MICFNRTQRLKLIDEMEVFNGKKQPTGVSTPFIGSTAIARQFLLLPPPPPPYLNLQMMVAFFCLIRFTNKQIPPRKNARSWVLNAVHGAETTGFHERSGNCQKRLIHQPLVTYFL